MDRRALIKLFSIATVTALSVRLFLIEDFRIASNSMFPNLKVGQLIFVSKSSFSIKVPFSSYEIIKFARPERSEVVAFHLPQKSNVTHVKRVVAVAGDRVEIKEGNLYVNDQLALIQNVGEESRNIASAEADLQMEKLGRKQPYWIHLAKVKASDYGPVDIPPNHFFVLGDNRSDSVDSRS